MEPVDHVPELLLLQGGQRPRVVPGDELLHLAGVQVGDLQRSSCHQVITLTLVTWNVSPRPFLVLMSPDQSNKWIKLKTIEIKKIIEGVMQSSQVVAALLPLIVADHLLEEVLDVGVLVHVARLEGLLEG